MTHREFLAVIERCRDQRGALTVLREAGNALERTPRAFGQLYKFIQHWDNPTTIDRCVRLSIQVLDHLDFRDGDVARAKDLLSAMLLATGERAADHERRARRGPPVSSRHGAHATGA